MDFQLSAEQAMLCESVERFVQDHYDFSARRALADQPRGYSRDHWRVFAEMGWLALPIAERNGGLGGSVVDSALLSRHFGKGLVLEPFLSSVLLGARLIEEIGTEDQKAWLLSDSVSGDAVIAVAHGEPGSRHDLRQVSLKAAREGDGYRLTGRKTVVTHAASADQILVVARTGGEAGDLDGLSVFLVSPDAQGLRRQDFHLADGQPASDLWLDDVAGALLGDAEGAAAPTLDRVFDEVLCAVCGDAVGAMEAVLTLTRDYVGTRRQFGRSIVENQVVQHRLADMFGALEEASALTEMTAMRLAEGEEGAARTVAGTAARVFALMRFVGEQGIQLHGGIGMTDEYPVGHYYKRLLTIEALFGSAAHHLQRFATAL
ncbi:MAG: acyl-CoA dehydrogenase family protein [Nitratireductor sp.]